MSDLIMGSLKIIKYVLHIGWASDLTFRLRTNKCNTCVFRASKWCMDCGCYLPAKKRLKSEKCPRTKW